MPDNTAHADTSGVRFPPPLYYLIGLLIGFVIQRFYPIYLARPGHRIITDVLGGVWIFLGLLLAGWALFIFRRAGTSPIPHVPTTALTSDGPYRLTRNPMYLAMALVCVGIGLAFNMLWPLVSVPVVMALVDRMVIAREERYLETKFGDQYRDYRKRVRRWI
ncbi:MAG: isoprenylcysteine carboxylmethyltransferase family protein [Gammaproteobacteria bacterium]|nr:isoprenylcysteine carboxylmethyltransferase family protein [Gammaproteobacteria bacterium]MDE1983651.1 isoprenylcysteine carboxylmethyltransferase family protein [Gammaproteobacteria bacterium]MDE2108709.1 isoprenylcysteine carboxylmethyltransferase family protein [Gammaproteobacteria bacterium]